MSDEIKQLIRERLPGTACRVIYQEVCADRDDPLPEHEFRILFNQVAAEAGDVDEMEDDQGEVDAVSD